MPNAMTIGGRAVLVAAALLFGSANAAIYQGHFDPPEYAGDATFSVPDSCLPDGDGHEFVAAGDSGCGIVDFLSATVTNQPPPIVTTLTFGPQSDVATLLEWLGGVLIGIDTGLIGPAASQTGPNFSEPPFYFLQFHTGSDDTCSECELSTALLIAQQSSVPTVDLLSCPDGPNTCRLVGPESAIQDPFVVINGAPEPGSLALIGGALLAGWLTRRRTRAH